MTDFPVMSRMLMVEGSDTRIDMVPDVGFVNTVISSVSAMVCVVISVSEVADRALAPETPVPVPQLNASHPPIVVRIHVMAAVPFSEEMYRPLFPRREIFPSALTIQSNFSQSPMAVLLQVMAAVPFSEDTYLL